MKFAALSLLIVCGTMLAAAAPARAAETIVEDIPVAGGLAALADAAEARPAPDRARFVAELARIIYSQPSTGPYSNEPVKRRITALFADAGQRNAPARAEDTVPVPLSAALWGQAVFHRPVDRRDLVGAILTDRSAALLCYGLSGMDDETLEFFAGHPSLLGRLAERAPAAVAAFGESLHIRGDRVVAPGGDTAAPLWEGVVGEKVTRPERFVQILFEMDRGRLAYLYDVLSRLDERTLAFALDSSVRDPGERLNRFKRLAGLARRGFVEWDATVAPFVRPPNALATFFARLRVEDSGAPAGLSSPAFWQRAFDGGGAGTPQTPAGGRRPARRGWRSSSSATPAANESGASMPSRSRSACSLETRRLPVRRARRAGRVRGTWTSTIWSRPSGASPRTRCSCSRSSAWASVRRRFTAPQHSRPSA